MKKYLLGFIVIAVAITISAFTGLGEKKQLEKSVLTTWYFDGSSAQIKDASHWRNTGTEPSDCLADGQRPCSIAVTASNSTDLQDYLDGFTSVQITNQSTKKRP